MRNRLCKLLLMLVFLLLPLFFCIQAMSGGALYTDTLRSHRSVANAVETYLKQAFPMAQDLQQLGLDLRLMGGQREQNGIFISEDGLMRNIAPPNQTKMKQNADAISEFTQRLLSSSEFRKNTYLAVIPTASGILQQNLPRFATSQMIDQQRQIEEIYKEVSVGVRTIDVYSALHAQQDQYIYYRTDNGLTSLGGYYVYTAIANRLRLSNRSLSQFDIEYLDYAYYGDLYQAPLNVPVDMVQIAPYRKVQPDILTLFHYSGNREYIVSHASNRRQWRYNTLYPRHLMDLNAPLSVYLGGASAVIDIRSSSIYSSSLLVFGDETAQAYLPFLANHFYQVKLVNLHPASKDNLADIHPEQYDQVLFVYSLENIIHTSDPAQVQYVPWR